MSILWQHDDNGPTWLDSGGGPLLLIDNQWLSHWHGYPDPDLDLNIPDDYERACAIDDSIGLLAVGPGQGLVLADEPLSTTWLPNPEMNGGIIVRWRYGPGHEAFLAAMPELPKASWIPSEMTLSIPTGQATLFDSADSGEDFEAHLSLQLPRGSYTIDTAEYAPYKEMALLLHRLTMLQ